MSDKEARILGAGQTVAINGKEYKASPITMQQLMELQREAVAFYKRQYLQTYAENFHLVPNGEQLLEKKLEEVARWDVKDCPARTAFDCSLVIINDALKDKLRQATNLDARDEPETDTGWRYFLTTALDREKISPGEVEALTNIRPYKASIPYDMWWTTGTWDGMVSIVYNSFKINHPQITRQEIASMPYAKIVESSRLIEALTNPALGNTQSSS